MRSPAPARVLILSDRQIVPTVSRTGTFEFEDLVASVDAVDIVPLGRPGGRIQRRLERIVPGAFRAPARLDRGEPYDLLFASFHALSELARLHPLGRVLALARRAFVNIDELWSTSMLRHRGDIELLRRFDRIYSPCAGALELLQNAAGRPCEHLRPSVDALRFAPGGASPARVIDLHLMGRRRPDLHQALREAAEKSQRFYYFDSLQSNPPMPNYVEHRLRLADLVRRTRYFVVDIANSDFPEKRGSQQEYGPRFVEGAAGGAILIGQAPRTACFDAQFWPGAVRPIEPDAASITQLLSELESEPERTERMRRTNAAQVLRRHDGVYRWEQILRAAGLEPMPALAARKAALEQRARAIASQDEDG
ncbi:MAG: glycosyltransferase family 1 protein [Deltaproteobacteria bacterium]|nr:glycosyltransferase family 1 protein [Deltaproteobacteria bacterium]